MAFAGTGDRGARGSVGTPCYSRNLPAPMRKVNRSPATTRALGARATATVKPWELLTKLPRRPQRATALLAAILVLQLVEE